MPRHWLMKSEPDVSRSTDLGERTGQQVLPWTGVRNYQARNFMRDQMTPGDGVLFYHSSCPQPGIAGLARDCRRLAPRPTQFDPRQPLPRPEVTASTSRAGCRSTCGLVRKTRLLGLPEMRAAPSLATMQVLQRGNRLSITPVTTCAVAGRAEAARPLMATHPCGHRPRCWWPSCWCWAASPASLPGCWAWAAA
jgi:predicted RNA-binding protein with PUA-like domain